MRSALISHLKHLFELHPNLVIVTPTTALAGMKIRPGDLTRGLSNTMATVETMKYVFLANFTGCPAVNLPVAYSRENVPIGLMGMAQWGNESLCCSLGRMGEEIWLAQQHKPETFYGILPK